MNCECNNKSNRVKPGIKHVYGNVLRMAIPLTLRTLVKDGDEMDVTDTDFIPSSDHPVRVVFSKGKTNYPIIATMDGNVAIVEDKGKIPVGTYDISVECYDDLGNPYRFKQNAVLYVADTTAEAGIDEEIEYEAQTWYLNAAVFLATTEIGEIGDVIDAKLDDVFGNVAYDADAKEIRFYNKGNSKVLATIDSRPFIADGTVADVYIDVSRQVLVVVLNEDAGGRMFSVPLYLVFNSYYKKDEVDNLVSRTVEGMRFDFSQELPLVVPVTKNGNSITSTVDFGAIDNAIREDGRLVVACVNDSEFYQLLDANRAEVSFSQVNALDGYQVLLIVDKHNVWSMEDVDLGTGGGGGYEPPAGGIPKTDLAPAVQASLAKADSALQPSDLQGYATTDDVDDAVAALVSSAPQTLDTLKELADALGDDPNFATTMATQLGNKVDKETGKSLMTDAERTKLQGIAAGAEVNVQPNWTQTNTSADDYIKNKPTLSTVATSGSYNDLSNKPTIPDVSTLATKTELNGKQDKINDLASIRINSGKGVAEMSSNADGTVVTTLANGDTYTIDLNHEHPQYVESDDLADVALSGSYNDLTDKPTIPDTSSFVTTSTFATALQGKADTSDIPTKVSDLTNDSGFTSNAGTITGITMNGASKGTSGVVDLGTVITAHQDISGKANSADLATVATSGSYNDLSNKPTIPAAQVQSDWNATSGMGVILNKPTIPSKTSDLTNDSGYINKSIFAGTCTTAAATMPKVCTVDTFPTTESNGVTHAADGTMIAVMFTNSDTNTSAAPTLNVNDIGAKAIYYSNAKVTSTAKNTTVAGTAKVLAYYYYDSSLDEGNGAWVYMGHSVDSNSTYSQASLGQGYGVQSNTAAATAITSSISSYALSAGGIVTIKFTYDVPANATLNISSKGAKAIYNKGAAIAAGVIKAGDTATFIYSTYYHLISVDSWQDNQGGGSVTIDSTPTSGSTNAVSSGGVYTALAGKADTSTTYTKSEIDTKIGNIETILASI